MRRETPVIRAVLFDLDGLMVDSEPHSLASWRAVLSSRGVSLDRAVSERMFGLRQSEAARLLAEVYGLTDRPSVLASNGIIHDEMLKVLREVRGQ